MAQVMDPTTGLNSPVMGRFFETLCFLFFLNVNGHHKIFEIMSQSFEDIPAGEPPWNLMAMKDGARLPRDAVHRAGDPHREPRLRDAAPDHDDADRALARGARRST